MRLLLSECRIQIGVIIIVFKSFEKCRLFLLELGETLTTKSVHRRAENRTVSGRPQIASAMAILGVNVCYGESPVAIGKKRGRCAHCPRNKEQKIANRCSLCHAFVCGIHSSKTTSIENAGNVQISAVMMTSGNTQTSAVMMT